MSEHQFIQIFNKFGDGWGTHPNHYFYYQFDKTGEIINIKHVSYIDINLCCEVGFAILFIEKPIIYEKEKNPYWAFQISDLVTLTGIICLIPQMPFLQALEAIRDNLDIV